MEKKIVYSRLKELRLKNDYTQKQIGEVLGLSQRGYAHYECGDYDFPGEYILKLAMFYHVTTDYIFELTDNPKVPRQSIVIRKELRSKIIRMFYTLL